MIRDRINARDSRLTRSEKLEEQILTARDEDRWDRRLEADHGAGSGQDGPSWTMESREALAAVKRVRSRQTEKRLRYAKTMTEIVEKERALANEENLQRRKGRMKQRDAEHDQRPAMEVPAFAGEEKSVLDQVDTTPPLAVKLSSGETHDSSRIVGDEEFQFRRRHEDPKPATEKGIDRLKPPSSKETEDSSNSRGLKAVQARLITERAKKPEANQRFQEAEYQNYAPGELSPPTHTLANPRRNGRANYARLRKVFLPTPRSVIESFSGATSSLSDEEISGR